MNRRHFLHRTSLGIPGLLLFPSLLAACKKEGLFENSSFTGRVAIIGAGAAGLYAAYLLRQQGIDVTILEASDRWGGRIRSLNGFTDFPVELGAGTIRGAHSSLYDMAAASGTSFVDAPLTDRISLDGTPVSGSAADNDADILQLRALIDALADYTGANLTASEWANVEAIPDRVAHLVNAWLGNHNGTSASRISVRGLARQENEWVAGEGNYVPLDRDLLGILESTLADILPFVRLSTPIEHVAYGGSGEVVLTTSEGETIAADKVIVTVPVQVLYEDLITFTPALPPLHIQAINNIPMDRGLMIALRFSTRFWPANTGKIHGTGLVPTFYPPGAGGKSAEDRVLTAFICGENADALHALGDTMVPTILAELDALFGEGSASAAYEAHHIQDWGEEPWIRGAYSYDKPATGASRGLLAEPVADKLYFAGEATHTTGHHGTVHGAMETAFRAVHQILQPA